MKFLTPRFALLLLSFFVIAACGQKGPLYLPGDPSQIRSIPPVQQSADDEEEDEESIPR